VGDGLRKLGGKAKTRRRAAPPTHYGGVLGNAIERAVDFDGTELAAIILQVLAGWRMMREKRAHPISKSKALRADKQIVHGRQYSIARPWAQIWLAQALAPGESGWYNWRYKNAPDGEPEYSQ